MAQSFLDGQQNLSALTVPGVYVDIILPSPLLLGVPTNIEGLVGVASWGPTNAVIPATQVADAALSMGPPQIRANDIVSHIEAATQIGGAIGFKCIRVTDGTDTAAAANLLAGGSTGATITAKYTGTMGNNISVDFVAATQANTLMAVVNFPGAAPEQFNNIATGAANASGSVLFTAQPAASSTITIGGTVVTFETSSATGNQVNIATSLAGTLQALVTMLNASTDTNISQCNYSISGTTLKLSVKAAGTAGNSFTLATTVTGATASGATLSGGTNAGNVFWTNLVNAINNGNAYRGPSNFVIATVGSATSVPTLTSPVTLSGGTDGASGVTDETLMGQDVLPRKGMYALRQSGCDGFTLVDLSTPAYWAAIESFGLSEDMIPVVSTASGTAYATTITDRVNAGADSPWCWIISGDWPTFYDAYNGVSRLINPTAFGIGILGNLSPQQSPLNKPLTGISATETSMLGETYSDTDLSLINTGGIDVILPASQSPGGQYYSFATGRNASSNTGANGVEYTRMTNFLARTFQTAAVGSFVGQLQSIQADDQTRQNVVDMFNGLLAQLASPQVGAGINGQGMIDIPWYAQCNLTNNTAQTQAAGYLFVYIQVRYLNVIRYFVVKFQGGGDVMVTSQSTAPTPSTVS